MKKSQEVSIASPEYRQFIEQLKARVLSARISAARAVNRDLILLYWDIGCGIVEKQQVLGWGESVVEMVSADLQRAFPQMTGFSPRNVWAMRRLYVTYAAPDFLSQAVRENDHGTSKKILRQAVAEFGGDKKRPQAVAKLPESKIMEFLPQVVAEIPWGHHRLILDKITDPAALLYYLRATARFGWSRNVLLNQIKAGPFEPEFAGKMDFYLNLLNDTERGDGDQPSIGIILCAEKDDVEVEYALRTKKNPIGVAVYQLQSKLPVELKGKLPTAKQLADVVRAVLPERSAP
jgi:predicted nuclease of restriction endonuclease-like (RecB) superfamily